MDLRYLRYFITVAEERSFTRAAERLHTVQPSLSQQIKRLEDVFVGTALFRRDRRHVELTEAGRAFLPQARAILDSVERAIDVARQVARAETGHLTIGFVPGAEGKVFPHVLPVLRARCPGVHLGLRSLSTPEQLEALRDHRIDVGFLRPPVEDPSLASEVVLGEEIVAAVPADHEIARLERIPVARLAELRFVEVARPAAPMVHDLANQIAARAGVRFETALITDNVLGTLNAVGSGLGFSLLPDYVRQVSPPTVTVRPLEMDPSVRIDLLVAYREGDELPVLRAFLDVLHTWMTARQTQSV